MMRPVDLTTGLPYGGADPQPVDVMVGYLITHGDGFEARLGPDRARAELYAARNRATLEPMFVRRILPTLPAAPAA